MCIVSVSRIILLQLFLLRASLRKRKAKKDGICAPSKPIHTDFLIYVPIISLWYCTLGNANLIYLRATYFSEKKRPYTFLTRHRNACNSACIEAFIINRHQHPLNSGATAQPYDSKRNRNEIPTRKGTDDRSNRQATRTYHETKPKEKKKKKRNNVHTPSRRSRDRMINRFSQYLSRGHGNFSNIVPSILSDNGISILPADKRSISLGPIDPDHCSRDQNSVLIPKKNVLSERCTVYGQKVKGEEYANFSYEIMRSRWIIQRGKIDKSANIYADSYIYDGYRPVLSLFRCYVLFKEEKVGKNFG